MQGENAPIGVYAAFAYTTALNKLLRHDSTSVARAGATTVVFWAGQETANEAVLCNLMSSMTAEEEWCAGTGGVADLLTAVRPGAPPPVEDSTPFFILALSAESGPRVTVCFFHQSTIAETACAISDWFEQSAIVPVDSPPLSLTVLLRALSPQGDIKYSTPLIGSEVLRSAYTGAPLPHQSLTVALLRSAAERGPTLERVALMKAFLVRNKRWRITVGLDPEELDPAYRLGRLFAVLEGIRQLRGGQTGRSETATGVPRLQCRLRLPTSD